MSKGKKKNASEQNEARALLLRIVIGFIVGMIVMLMLLCGALGGIFAANLRKFK